MKIMKIMKIIRIHEKNNEKMVIIHVTDLSFFSAYRAGSATAQGIALGSYVLNSQPVGLQEIR